MIVYNVTLSILPEIENEVVAWLKNEHIPEVMDTNLFLEYKMFRIVENPITKTHNSFAIQYVLESWENFETYNTKHAPLLRAKTIEKYGERVLAFRTFLEKI
ncbi:MAG: DUF4286 family protein [Bacteroidia bacterium]|nr:DUF4286 family protein [Bacteroidia bacterium]NNJ56721.1 DUF4286 family protein [Bacteroidia bacterium]